MPVEDLYFIFHTGNIPRIVLIYQTLKIFIFLAYKWDNGIV